MKTLGIIGGIAPESTIEYYRTILAAYRLRRPDGSYPPLLINSIDLKRMLDLAANDLAGLTGYLLEEVEKLARAGAGFGLLASNTPHIVFPALAKRSPIPLLSIVECACRATQALGLTKVGLFGTRFTMEGTFYPEVFTRAGIELVTPKPDDRAYIHHKYMTELVPGVFLPETRQGLLAIVDRLREEAGIQGLILGGTELPLILREPQGGFPFLDTSRIHAERAVAEMLG